MENFEKIECYKCGVIFAVSKTFESSWRRDKSTFYCPNGHGQSYTKSTAELLEERIKEKDRKIFEKDTEIFRLEKENRRLKKRNNPLKGVRKYERRTKNT